MQLPSQEQWDFFRTLQEHAGWGWALFVLTLALLVAVVVRLLMKSSGAQATVNATGGAATATSGDATGGAGGSASTTTVIQQYFTVSADAGVQQAAAGTPHAQLTASQKQAIADRLQALDNEAVHQILNGSFLNEAELLAAERNWRDRVIAAMQEGNANFQMMSSIQVLGDVPYVAYVGKPDWAQKTLRELSLRRRRLEKIIARYTTDWP